MTHPILQALSQRAKEFLDPDLEGNAADAFLYCLVHPDPIRNLGLKNKLLLLKAVCDYLPSSSQQELASTRFTVARTVEGGDYGIDIEDALQLDESWVLNVRADGGSGRVCPGEDEDSIEFNLLRLIDYLDSIDFDLDLFDWSDLVLECDSEPGIIYVTPGEGIEGFGEPFFSISSTSGQALDMQEVAIRAVKEGSTDIFNVEILFACNGSQYQFATSFCLSDLESFCIGHNLEWSISEPGNSSEFMGQVECSLKKGLSCLRNAIKDDV